MERTDAVKKSPWKCPAHNVWRNKTGCELCKLEMDKIQKQNEAAGGSNKPEVRIKKL